MELSTWKYVQAAPSLPLAFSAYNPQVHKFVRKLITEWRRLELPIADETVVVAVSGGADSTALLLALSELKKRKKLDLGITVAHFNHKLSGKKSDADEHFVQTLAAANDFKFQSGTGSLKRRSDLEQQARNARYSFLAKVAEKARANLVLTAHTVNDQAETFLLNLIRGSGIDGLRAMKSLRPFETNAMPNSVMLARPFLSWAKRDDTEEFCRDLAVEFRNDEMNDDLRFTRVRVRKSILPELAEINPKIVETLANTARLLQQTGELTAKAETTAGKLSLNQLQRLSTGDLNSALRLWIVENRGSSRGLDLKHIEAVGRLVKSRKSGRIVELPGGFSVVKSGGRLAFRHIKLEY